MLIIIIGWVNNNHFQLLLPFSLTNEEYPIEFKIQDINKNKSDTNINVLKSMIIIIILKKEI